jgi:hypothetical protein
MPKRKPKGDLTVWGATQGKITRSLGKYFGKVGTLSYKFRFFSVGILEKFAREKRNW